MNSYFTWGAWKTQARIQEVGLINAYWMLPLSAEECETVFQQIAIYKPNLTVNCFFSRARFYDSGFAESLSHLSVKAPKPQAVQSSELLQ